MFTETDNTNANWLVDAFRTLLTLIDRAAYGLLGIMYQIFFNFASVDLFINDTIMKFYGRIQLILGVFMLFQLAMTILKGIVNPDSFTDSKSGAGNVIMRICVSLVLLTLLMPISIPNAKNEYEKQINNNGILFGTLYSLQHRLLANNTLGKLILGTTDEGVYVPVGSNTSTNTKLEYYSRVFTSTIIKGFYRINLKPESQRTKHEAGKDDAAFNENRMCEDIDDAYLTAYTKVDADPGDIISMVNVTCGGGLFSSSKYAFTIMPIVSFIVPVIFVFILLSFSVDVAIRAVKLAVLRLIAPVPVISYMDPKGGKDGAFNAWVKSLTSTYLDLFIRLASVYFVLFLIQDTIVNGLSMGDATGVIRVFTVILVWIGLFAFARQAPKFIKQALGMKDDGGKGLFSGFGEIGNALGMGAAVVGSIGAFNAARTASRLADVTNNENPNTPLNRGKHLLAGIAGGIGGLSTGMSAAMGAKDHANRAVMDALQKRNATAIQRGAAGSTMFGRVGANLSRTFQGEGATSFDRETRNIAQLKGIEKTGKDLFTYLEGKGKSDGAVYTVTTAAIDALGGATVTGEYDTFKAKRAKALAAQAQGGNGEFQFGTRTFDANSAVAEKVEQELAYAAGHEWAQRQENNHNNYVHEFQVTRAAHPDWSDSQIEQDLAARSIVDGDFGYMQKKETYNEAVKTLEADYGTYRGSTNPISVSKLRKMANKAAGVAVHNESSESYKRQKANFGATDKK